MTPERFEELANLRRDIGDPDWFVADDHDEDGSISLVCCEGEWVDGWPPAVHSVLATAVEEDYAATIVGALNAVPELLDEVVRLRGQVAELLPWAANALIVGEAGDYPAAEEREMAELEARINAGEFGEVSS